MRHRHPDWPKTLEEFRAWHEREPEVWEFIYGVPKLMAPGSTAQTVIKGNAYAALAQALRGTRRSLARGLPHLRLMSTPLWMADVRTVQVRPDEREADAR
jgi:hypothetical protein